MHNCDLSRLDTVTPEDEQCVLKYRMALAILDKDYYYDDLQMYRKIIPLDLKGRYSLSEFYNNKGIQHFSLDVSPEKDCHYEFAADTYKVLSEHLPSTHTLPEALSIYLSDHTPAQFAELLIQHNLLIGVS